jgi:hypothetical protein
MREGKLILHRENEDYNFVKHGLDETKRGITREEVAERFPELLAEVDEILAGERAETRTLLR